MESDLHRAYIAQYLVPLIYTNSLLSAGYGGEYLTEAVLPVLVQGQRHVDGVYHPSQENLAGGPGEFI